MVELFVYLMIMYGLSFCIVHAAGPFNIFSKYRVFAKKHFPSNLGDSVDCMFCTPFQLGLLFSLINIVFFDYAFTTPYFDIVGTECWFLNIIFDGAFTASGVYLIDTLQNWFEE